MGVFFWICVFMTLSVSFFLKKFSGFFRHFEFFHHFEFFRHLEFFFQTLILLFQ